MTNISGFWVGHYTYDNPTLSAVDFDVEITHTQDHLSGVITEPNSFKEFGYKIANDLISATLTGSLSGSTLTFLKIYQGQGVPEDPVTYNGHLDKDETCISGTWSISTHTGAFEMRRDGPAVGVKAKIHHASEEVEIKPTLD